MVIQTGDRIKIFTTNWESVVRRFPLCAFVASAAVVVGCGNGTVGNADAGYHGDVIYLPNASWCHLIIPDAAVLAEPTEPGNSAVMCGWDMPIGTRCRSRGGVPGVCRDFVAESGGYFAEYARMNRVPRYCWPEGLDPCGASVIGMGMSFCARSARCLRIPAPPPMSPGWMCPPEPCN